MSFALVAAPMRANISRVIVGGICYLRQINITTDYLVSNFFGRRPSAFFVDTFRYPVARE